MLVYRRRNGRNFSTFFGNLKPGTCILQVNCPQFWWTNVLVEIFWKVFTEHSFQIIPFLSIVAGWCIFLTKEYSSQKKKNPQFSRGKYLRFCPHLANLGCLTIENAYSSLLITHFVLHSTIEPLFILSILKLIKCRARAISNINIFFFTCFCF